MKAYTDDDGRRRCGDCTAFLKAGVRTCQRCKARAEKAEKKAADEKRRINAFRDRGGGQWRKGRLSRYVKHVLATSGAERKEFFARYPVSDVFK